MKRAASSRRTKSVLRRVGRFAFTLAYTSIVAFFFAGYLARYVHPRYAWWMQLCAVLLPFASAVVAVAIIPVVLSKRWALLGFHVVLLVLIGVRFYPAVGFGGGVEAPNVDELRILTFNFPSTEDRDERAEALLDLYRRERPDIVCFQETYFVYKPAGRPPGTRRDVITLLEGSPLSAWATPVGERFETDQPILTKLPVSDLETIALKYGSDPSLLEVTRAELAWKGRPFAMYNLHLASYGERKPWREEEGHLIEPRVWVRYLRQYRLAVLRRAWEVDNIRRLLEKETLPYIIAGDFNSTAHNWTYHHLLADHTDSFYAAGNGSGLTYHRRLRFARIDFVLVPREMEVVLSTVPKASGSDHRPVVAVVRWR